MLATYVALHDIEDVEGFVCATIERSGIRLERQEKEDLVGEGIVILYELADRFEPQRAGYATSGRFSGYAAQFLPRRLGDAWHQRHPEHRRVADKDGKRRWSYTSSPLSLDSLTSGTNGRGQAGGGGEAPEPKIRPRTQWAPPPTVKPES